MPCFRAHFLMKLLSCWLVCLGWFGASSPATAQPNGLWAEARVSEDRPFVQQGVVYRIQIYSAFPLSKVVVDRPTVPGMAVERLTDPLVQTTVTRAGRRFHVTNYHFAVTPLVAGPAEVPAMTVEVTASSMPWGWGEQTRELSVPAVALEARPAAADLEPWLPARALTLEADWDHEANLAVGQPLRFTLRLRIEGGGAYQLPSLQPWLASEDFKMYSDERLVEQKVSWDNEDIFLAGERRETFSLVPKREGTLTLPPIQLTAWDTRAGKPFQVEWPGATFTLGAPPSENPVPAEPAQRTWTREGLIAAVFFILGWIAARWEWRATRVRLRWGARWARRRWAYWRVRGPRQGRWLWIRGKRSLRGWRQRWVIGHLPNWLPLPLRVWVWQRAMARATSARELYRQLDQFSHRNWRTPANAPLSRIGEALLARYPRLSPARHLLRQLDQALYAADAPPFPLAAWQRRWQQATRGLALRIPRRTDTQAKGHLPLNPLDDAPRSRY